MAAASDSPLPYTTPDELWQTALSELRGQMTKATFNSWLADSRVLTEVSTLHSLVIAVRNQYAREWLTHRLAPVIARTLAYITGGRVELHFVCNNYANRAIVNSLEGKWYEPLPKGSGQAFALNGYISPSTPHLKGDMTMTNQLNARRVRIYSHIIQSRFLHVEDALAIGKLRLFAGNYRKGQGMNSYAHAYVDMADARVIFAALVNSSVTV